VEKELVEARTKVHRMWMEKLKEGKFLV